MKPIQIPFLKFDENDEIVENAVQEVVRSGVYFNGTYTESFKHAFANYVGRKFMVPTANCTDALELVLRRLGLDPNDQVIVPAFGWYSDVSMVNWVGAKPLFLDVDLSTFSVSIDGVRAVYNEKVKALILPHLFGMITPQIEEIVAFCRANQIFLIEDCAQAHGAVRDGKQAGSFGDVSVFSFYPTKNLGAIGDGGCILTDSDADNTAYTMLANHGQLERNVHEILGRNSRMDEIQAAILSKRLPYLSYQNKKRRELADIYFQQLKHLPIQLPQNDPGHVFHQFVVLCKQRDALKNYLDEQGIETAVHYPKAIYEMQPFKQDNKLEFSNSYTASREGLSLPIYPNHSVEEILFICEQVSNFFND